MNVVDSLSNAYFNNSSGKSSRRQVNKITHTFVKIASLLVNHQWHISNYGIKIKIINMLKDQISNLTLKNNPTMTFLLLQ